MCKHVWFLLVSLLLTLSCGDTSMPPKQRPRPPPEQLPADPWYDDGGNPLTRRAVEQSQQTAQAAPRPLTNAPQNSRGNGPVTISPVIDAFSATVVEQIRRTILETPKRSSDEAEAITITLGYTDTNLEGDADQDEPVFLTAKVLWGIGGCSFEAEIDWEHGKSFTLFASYVRIDAVYDIQANFLGEPPSVLLTAGAAYGTTDNSKAYPLKLTRRIGAIAIPSILRIPRWATAITVLTMDAGVVLNFLKSASGIVGTEPGAVVLPTTGIVTIPLPGGSSYVMITPAGLMRTMSVIFHLSL